MMIDRFRKFTDEELVTLMDVIEGRIQVEREEGWNPDPMLPPLRDGIEHEQIQRKHAAARQMVPA